MVNEAVSIVDRLIQLATVRERNREKLFNNFIEPLYRDGEQIAKDYMTLLAELTHRIRRASGAPEIIDWLEERRAALQPLRVKVRALIDEQFMLREFMEREKKHNIDSFYLFRKGLWGLMKGGVSAIDDGSASTWEYGFGSHTVLDLLHHARLSTFDQDFRDRLTERAQTQQKVIERAWLDVTNAYAELKRKHVG